MQGLKQIKPIDGTTIKRQVRPFTRILKNLNFNEFVLLNFVAEMFYFRVSLYIANGWDTTLLKDPNNGKNYQRKRAIILDPQKRELGQILNSNLEAKLITSLKNIPRITHSTVEEYFKLAGDKRHITEVYAFSKTKKFETSGKSIQMNTLLSYEQKFLLEDCTRPSMKQACTSAE